MSTIEDGIVSLEPSIDLEPVLNAMDAMLQTMKATQELIYGISVGQAILMGVLLGAMIIFVLAVMFHDW